MTRRTRQIQPEPDGYKGRAIQLGPVWARPVVEFTVCSPALPTCSPRRYRPSRHASFMADLLVVLGIILFAALMLGLIWALERV